MLACSMSDGQRGQTRQTYEQLFEQAVKFIARNLGDRDLALAVVARELVVSPRQLQRVFAEVAGECFSDYLLRVRMERARVLLDEGMSGRQAAAHVGYGSSAALAKGFRRYWGVGPRD
jgi:two-component system response regulator YesN